MNIPELAGDTVDPVINPRQKIAMALQAQKGLFKQTPMGNFGNSMLQMWNMNRPRPGATPPPTPPLYSVGE